MSLSLTHVITVVPLRKPREKLWLKRSCVKEKANQITQVLEKFEKVDDNRDDSLLRPRRNSKNESDNRPAVSNLKGVSRESPGLLRALKLYSPNNLTAAKWRSALRPLSIYQQSLLEKSVRDYTRLYSVQHTPPQTTLSVRWRNHGTVPSYTEESLQRVFGHFGSVRKISFQSECSAHVVLENAESACAALSLSNLGFPECPLHVRWLPEEHKRLLWKRKDAVPKPMKEIKMRRRDTASKESCGKRPRFQAPQALTRPSQICCTFHTKTRS
ncbi:unnamed protein product [Porites lobata]|uniref:RRM domain-containing protein n=1 Tax=Porites lobata TaxID=104759 RepID=A0ABN8PXV4_9CNID|nr:unnamed protein product [Porites lobata]